MPYAPAPAAPVTARAQPPGANAALVLADGSVFWGRGADTLLGPEMKSTGEVMGIDTDFGRAFAKSQLAAGMTLPRSGTVFVSVKDRDKEAACRLARRLVEMGFTLMATSGTALHLRAASPTTRPSRPPAPPSMPCSP